MATLNFIMPSSFGEGFCGRKEKENKTKHSWLPSGQTRATIGSRVAIECFCKHCNQREWTEVSRSQFETLQKQWSELR
jgi:hypothetical protein